MAVKVEVPYRRMFEVGRACDDVFSYLSNVEKAVPENFPGVEQFQPLGSDSFRWVFEKVGYSSYEIQIRLATRFQFDRPRRISASAIPEPNSCMFNGFWDLSSIGAGTQITFDAKLEIDLPIPFFLKAMAVPLAQKELTKLFDRYINRVEQNLAK